MHVPLTDATVAAFLAAAEESEIGLAIRVDDTNIASQLRQKLSALGAGQGFTCHLMDNPVEIWLVKKGTDVGENLDG